MQRKSNFARRLSLSLSALLASLLKESSEENREDGIRWAAEVVEESWRREEEKVLCWSSLPPHFHPSRFPFLILESQKVEPEIRAGSQLSLEL